MSEALDSFIKKVKNGQSFFALKRPQSDTVEFYILADSEVSKEATTYFCLCGFEEVHPKTYASIERFTVSTSEVLNTAFNPTPLAPLSNEPKNTTAEEYISGVEQAKLQFNSGKMSKVVLAQNQVIPVNDLTPLNLFKQLLPIDNSYCYCLHLKDSGTWIGASPELFFKINGNQLETMALAGTRNASHSVDWGEKEQREQAIVGEYLTAELSALGLSDIRQFPAFTKTLGNIEHICSPVSGTLPEGLSWKDIANRLHPTPALAGYPKSVAMEFIRVNENFDRELFGGFMGIVDADSVELFVNIRCAQLYTHHAQLFAGAGLNADSVPELEWQETQNKLHVMQSLF